MAAFKKTKKPKPKKRILKAFADVGSHGGIFEFCDGPVALRYPGLLQIYTTPGDDTVPVTITY